VYWVELGGHHEVFLVSETLTLSGTLVSDAKLNAYSDTYDALEVVLLLLTLRYDGRYRSLSKIRLKSGLGS
jgi:hypothetical protein